MDVRSLIEIICALSTRVCFGLMLRRLVSRREIFFPTLFSLRRSALSPAIIILALGKVLEPSAIGALLGGLVGVAPSGIGDKKKDE